MSGCTSSNDKNDSNLKAQFVNEKFTNMEFKVEATLTTFNAPAHLYDGKPGDKQVNVERVYFVINETLYFLDFINNNLSHQKNEEAYEEYLKSIEIDKTTQIDWFGDDSLKQENFTI